ncbi:hypothetical protein H4R19_006151, partial [Coemansia spiralis]
APPFLRNSHSTAHPPASPTASTLASAMTEPYVSSSRAASAANVAVWQDSTHPPPVLASDARAAMARLRSKSQETPASLLPTSAIAVPAAAAPPEHDDADLPPPMPSADPLPAQAPAPGPGDEASDSGSRPLSRNA